MTLGEFAEAVAALCGKHNGSVTSWIRTSAHNTAVGSVHSNSQHQLSEGGYAMDIKLDDNTPTACAALCTDAIAAGLQPVDETTHVHIQVHR